MSIIGNIYHVDFGMATSTLSIESETSMSLILHEKDGEQVNTHETVAIKLTELTPQLVMLTWKERNGTTVTQVHDLKNGIVYANRTSPGGDFTHVKGTISQVRE